MDKRSATGVDPQIQVPERPAPPHSCLQAQDITVGHKAFSFVGVLLLVLAIIGTTIIPMMCAVSDSIYSWMAGYVIGYGFASAAHELIALVTGQPCELRRYGAWFAYRWSRRGEVASTLSAGVKSDLELFFSAATLPLIVIAAFLLISVTVMFQTNIVYTQGLTISTIIGAAVSSEIVGPHIASIQSKKMSKLAPKA
jgi:hypothetical protein